MEVHMHTLLNLPRDPNAGRRRSMKTNKRSLEMMGRVQIFGNSLIKLKFYSGRN